MNDYTDTDQEAFDRIKKGLTHWSKSTVMAAELIVEAKERQIWKVKYDSWKDFCACECGITVEWTRRLMQASKATKEIANFRYVSAQKSGKPNATGLQVGSKNANEIENTPVPTNETRLTPNQEAQLRGLSVDQKSAVLEVARAGGSVAPADIAAARTKLAPKPDSVTLDSVGWPIPDDILPVWFRAREVKELMAKISFVRCDVASAQEDNDPLFSGFNFSGLISYCDQAYAALKQAIPYAVCTSCQGRLLDGCRHCKGKGFISELAYKMVPAETRAIREKASKR